MPDYPGIFIVLEGSDGSGKGTQFKLLGERLKAVGYEVANFDFPRYNEPSSHFVKRYLNGDYGPASQISPYSASLFYALDRYEAAKDIRSALAAGKVVLSNRYVGSNMAHQGAKFTNNAEQRGFFIWADSLEYQLLGIPRPNLNLFLRVPADVSYELIEKKNQREYTDKKRDEHEADIEHLRRSVETYDVLCQLFPKDFRAIECVRDDKLMGIPEISDLIWKSIKPMLPAKPARPPRETVVNLEEPATKPVPPPSTKPDRSPEPAKPAPGRTKLSLLALTELSKNGGLSLEGLEFDLHQPDYYTLGLQSELLKQYQAFMKQVSAYRRQISEEFRRKNINNAGETLGLLLPMSTYCYLPDRPDGAKLKEPRLDQKDNTVKKRLEQMAQDQVSGNLSTDLDAVTLLEAWPRNEFDLLSDSLYDVSDLPRQQVQAGLENWSYEQKYQALNSVLADIEPAISDQVRYRWDVIAEQGLLIELMVGTSVSGIQMQAPTPRYGYDVPKVIEKAGLETEFIECFDLSLEMFSKLQAGKDPSLAAYATLNGHKIRFQFSLNLTSLKNLPRYRSDLFNQLLDQLLESISETHPIIADSLKRQLEPKPKKAKSGRQNSGRQAK